MNSNPQFDRSRSRDVDIQHHKNPNFKRGPPVMPNFNPNHQPMKNNHNLNFHQFDQQKDYINNQLGQIPQNFKPQQGILPLLQLDNIQKQQPKAIPKIVPESQGSYRHARRIYIGNIPDAILSDTLKEWFYRSMEASEGLLEKGNPIVKVQIDTKQKYAFLEIRSIEETTAMLQLDGIYLWHRALRIRRPTEYDKYTKVEGTRLVPELNLDILRDLGITIIPTKVIDGPNKIFLANIPQSLDEWSILQNLKISNQFGPVKAFHLVKDNNSNESKGYAFFELMQPELTDKCIEKFHHQNMFGRQLTCKKSMGEENQDIQNMENQQKNNQQQQMQNNNNRKIPMQPFQSIDQIQQQFSSGNGGNNSNNNFANQGLRHQQGPNMMGQGMQGRNNNFNRNNQQQNNKGFDDFEDQDNNFSPPNLIQKKIQNNNPGFQDFDEFQAEQQQNQDQYSNSGQDEDQDEVENQDIFESLAQNKEKQNLLRQLLLTDGNNEENDDEEDLNQIEVKFEGEGDVVKYDQYQNNEEFDGDDEGY